MSISTVAGQTCTVELSESKEQWRPFLEIATARTLLCQQGNCGKLVEYFKQNIIKCPVHSESVLAQYLTAKDANVWDNIPSLSYIGVSKPSCHACCVWLRVFNEIGQQMFYTQKSDGKWQSHWVMPTAQECLRETTTGGSSGKITFRKSLRGAVAGMISSEYIMYLNKQRL